MNLRFDIDLKWPQEWRLCFVAFVSNTIQSASNERISSFYVCFFSLFKKHYVIDFYYVIDSIFLEQSFRRPKMASFRVDSISIFAESIFVESAGESKIASKSFSSISLRRFWASMYSSTSSRIKGGTEGILRTQIFVLFKRDILRSCFKIMLRNNF